MSDCQPFQVEAGPQQDSPDDLVQHVHKGMSSGGGDRDSGLGTSTLVGTDDKKRLPTEDTAWEETQLQTEGETSETTDDSGSSSATPSPPSSQHSNSPSEFSNDSDGIRKGQSKTYKKSVQEKRKQKEEPDYTLKMSEHCYTMSIAGPDAYKLNGKASIEEEMLVGSLKEKTEPKVNMHIKVLPEITKDNNEIMTQIQVKLTIERLDTQHYICVAIVSTSLYDAKAMKILCKTQSKRKFQPDKNYIKLIADLVPQEKIEESSSKSWEMRIGVEVALKVRKYEMSEGEYDFLKVSVPPMKSDIPLS